MTVVVLSGALRPLAVDAQTNTQNVRADADWILSAQLPDGAIANYVDKQAVWPYLSNFAAMGLVRATEVTGNRRYVDAAWRWLSWYQSHQDAQGFVYDYVVRNGVLTSTGFMDSTDSYAATFLTATRAAYRATNDRARVRGLRAGIANAVRAIEATQEPDGLTWAKPSWRVKYLMDQAETYAGLLAAVDLATVLNDSALGTRARANADRMRAGVDKLWNTLTLAYDWAVHESGARRPNDWSILYSDSLQQAWAVAFGLVDPVRSTLLMTRFNVSQPNWALPLSTALFSGGSTQTVGYWPVAALAYSGISSPLVGPAISSIRSASISSKRAWPFTTGNAGQLILLESYTPTAFLVPTLSALVPGGAPPTTTTPTTPTTTTTTTTTLAPNPLIPLNPLKPLGPLTGASPALSRRVGALGGHP